MMATIRGHGGGSLDNPQSSLIGPDKIGRALIHIPKEQRSILEKPVSWVDNLQNDSPDVFNIPKEVLKGLERFESDRKRHAPLEQSQASTPEEPAILEDAEPSDKANPVLAKDIENDVSEEVPVSSLPVSQHDNDDGDDEIDSTHTWESSPERVIIPQTETRKRASPEESPLRARAPPLSPHQMGQNFACMDMESSSDSEPDQNVVKADSLLLQPATRLDPTPPSAQIIPCTYHQRSSPPGQPHKKRRKMKTIDLDAPVLTSRKSPDRLAHLRLIPNTRVEDVKSSNETSSPSVIAETSGEQDGQDRIIVAATIQPNAMPNTKPDANPTQQVFSSLEQVEQTGTQTSQYASGETVLLPPFESFKRHYTEYKGSANDFVRACFYIRKLQDWKALPSFLYDDFIRAFTEGYIPYVNDPRHASQAVATTLLTGIKWYNENVEAPVFNDRLIEKQNIDEVLKVYRKEVNELKISAGMAIDPEDLTDAEDVSSEIDPGEVPKMDAQCSEDDLEVEVEDHQSQQEERIEEHVNAEDQMEEQAEDEQDQEDGEDEGMEEYRRFANELRGHVHTRPQARDPISESEESQGPDEEVAQAMRAHEGQALRDITKERHQNLLQPVAAARAAVLMPPSTAGKSIVSTSVTTPSRRVPSSSSTKASHLTPAERSKKWKKFLAKRKSLSVPSSARSSFGGH